MSLLHNAVKSNHLEDVKLLVEQGADKDKRDWEGQTPLLLASKNGLLEVAQNLVEQGATLDKSDNQGQTPLLWASRLLRNCSIFGRARSGLG